MISKDGKEISLQFSGPILLSVFGNRESFLYLLKMQARLRD